MNVIIIRGKIISKVDLKFIYSQNKKNKHISIARCSVKLDNESIVEIYGYDKIADKLYQEQRAYIWIEGKLDSKMQIKVKDIINL